MHTTISIRTALLALTAGFAVGAAMLFGAGVASAATLSVPGTYATIQDAINAASNGDTINVAAGTYAENVVLNKDVTLNGAQVGVDARGRVASESVITPTTVGITLVTGSAGATIDGFTISGGTRGIESGSGPLDGLGILNNRIVSFTSAGIFLNDNGSDITVDKNLIDAASQTASGGVVHLDQDAFDGLWFTNNNVVNGSAGTGLFSDGTRNVGVSGSRSPKMTGNLFQANGTGVNIGRKSWEFADISGNTFKSNTFDGLQGGPADSTISSNLFDSNGRSGLALTGFGGGTDATRGAQRNTVSLNTFNGNVSEGIFLSTSQFAGTMATNVINRNGIAGNAFGLRYGGTESINAECNWWGASNGPGPIGPGSGDQVGASATIDYNPWLTTSDLANGPCNGPLPVTVTIVKYIDGQHATTQNANGSSFPMQSSWNAQNIGAGSGTYPLGPTGFNNPNPYEATTASMTSGADYATNEDTTGQVVGPNCSAGTPYALVGYTTGDTLSQAQAGTPSATPPAFTGLTADKFVIVWNRDCAPKLTVTKIVINDNGGTKTVGDFPLFVDGNSVASGATSTYSVGSHTVSETNDPGYSASIGGDCDQNGGIVLAPGDEKTCTITNNDNPPPNVTVTIVKYVNGVHATSQNTNSTSFPMTATWNAQNIGAGSGTYPLGPTGFNNPNPYEATTASMTSGADYSTSENMSTTCNPNGYQLIGYSTGDSLAAAQSAPITGTASFTNITTDKFVIVWNGSCTPPPPANACSLTQAPSGYTLVNGSTGSDTITLAPGTMFKGNGGNDKVTAPDGNYIICTGKGNDIITIGNGDYTIDAGDGNNTVTTGNGAGPITTGKGNDIITTGNGAHTINAGGGNNTITTGDGVQNVTALTGNDKVTTGTGNDTINAGGGNNTVKSGGGDDTVTVLNGNDTVDGGSGTDVCNAGGGMNTVTNCP